MDILPRRIPSWVLRWQGTLERHRATLFELGKPPITVPGPDFVAGLAGGKGKRFAGWWAAGFGAATPSGEVRIWRAGKPGLAGYVELVTRDGGPSEYSLHNFTAESRAELSKGERLVRYLEEGRAELLHARGRPKGSYKGARWPKERILEWWDEVCVYYADHPDEPAPALRDLADAMGVSEKTASKRVKAAGLGWPPA